MPLAHIPPVPSRPLPATRSRCHRAPSSRLTCLLPPNPARFTLDHSGSSCSCALQASVYLDVVPSHPTTVYQFPPLPSHALTPSLYRCSYLLANFVLLSPSPSGFLQSSVITGSRFSSFSSPVSPFSSSNPCPVIILYRLSIICLRSLSSPTNLAACRHPLQLNAQAPLLISVQDLVQPELSNCIQLLQLAHTKCLLGGGLFFGGILRSTDSIDGIALKRLFFFTWFSPWGNVVHFP